ncbi:hypothetical protein MVEN_02515800 [Mycena venus]|uniref:Uncharacterized protein n=1 Tax=Mycena venus TaxID=2733690 RepID=A0A8H6WUJ0_9AGAR|nr:hypothetical protein MVEN_02515800 [Mycena venus]
MATNEFTGKRSEMNPAFWEAFAEVENRPSWVLQSPFGGNYELELKDEPLGPMTVFELAMYELSWSLRSKPEWQHKAADSEILRKWRQEALDQQTTAAAASGVLSLEVRLTEKMIDYVLAELDGYAKIVDNERGIERACFEAIWYSDRLIPNDLLQRLKSSAKALEEVPEDRQDWQPNGQGLDLVHPSLYCVVYGRTHAYLPGKPRITANFLPVQPPRPDSIWTSEKFAWLPSDFAIDSSGSVKLVSPYINNLHPVLYQPLYRVIEEVLTAFVPMFERVIGDSNRENGRVPYANDHRLGEVSCIWGDPGGTPYPEDDPGSDEDEEEFNERYRASIPKILPEAKDYGGELEARFRPVSLRGRTIQCIIKLANIYLTPEQPKYNGGNWLLAGTANERIVASGIYYYDEENSRNLNFRSVLPLGSYPVMRKMTMTRQPVPSDDPLVQDIGSVATKSGRALFWPNLFQHCVSPFKLADPSKPGYRKSIAVFLVDPTKDPIVSATDVPPQQAEWAGEALEEACADPASLLGALPQELRDLVKDQFPQTVMTREEAEAYRLDYNGDPHRGVCSNVQYEIQCVEV